MKHYVVLLVVVIVALIAYDKLVKPALAPKV